MPRRFTAGAHTLADVVRASGRPAGTAACTSLASRWKGTSACPVARRRRRWRRRSTTFAGAAGPEDVVFITLIGHGSALTGERPSSTCRGPTWRPADFEPLLKKLPTKQVVFVNTASASGSVSSRRCRVRAARWSRRRAAAPSTTRRLFGGYFVDALNSSERPTRTRTSGSACSRRFSSPRPKSTAPTSAKGLLADRARRCSMTTGTRKGRTGSVGDRRRTARWPRCSRSATRARTGCRPIPKLARSVPGAARDGAPRRDAAAAEGQHGPGEATVPSSKSWSPPSRSRLARFERRKGSKLRTPKCQLPTPIKARGRSGIDIWELGADERKRGIDEPNGE